jgi:hypothetical protein
MIMCTLKCAAKPALPLVQRAKNWMSNDDGAITVDWVVLTATMTVIGGIIVAMTVDGTTDVGNQIGTVLTNKPVN